MKRFQIAFVVSVALAGCAQEPPAAPVAPVKVQVTAHDFCQIVRRATGGPVTWSRLDSPETITGIRRVNAAYARRCVSRPTPKQTS